jgi:hypothetical protein
MRDEDMKDKHAHLEMIQGVINRLSQNSFLLKGWSVVLVSALLGLAVNGTNILFIYLAYFPVVSFWMLDGFFLWQERLFRALYDKVRELPDEDIDFSMNTGIVNDQVDPWCGVVFSKTLLAFHGTVVASVIIVMLIAILSIPGGQ